MTEVLRRGLRTVTVMTLFAAAWLAWVLVTVVPLRDPDSEPLWAAVAAASLAVGLAAIVATANPERVRGAVAVALGVLSAAALAFGSLAIASGVLPSDGAGEGYLLLLGSILAAQGALGLLWLAAVARARRRR
jgi:hypothetical protein